MFLFKDETTIGNIRISDAAIALSVSSATIRNWIKIGLLESDTRGFVSCKSLKSVKETLIGDSKLISRANKSQKNKGDSQLSRIAIMNDLSSNIFDESIAQKYENSLSESYRNKEGVYYTDQNIVTDMLQNIEINSRTTFLDPCCGCGNFILEAIDRGVKVKNLYGFDTDAIAVEITKKRVFHKTGEEPKNIICGDFLTIAKSLDKEFDLIYTNPPWGKKIPKSQKDSLAHFYMTGKSTDTCSLFVFASAKRLSKHGSMGFLLPESVLNIATFQSLRKLFLSLSIQEVKNYGKPFKGVQSRAYSILVENHSPKKNHQIRCIEDKMHLRLQSSFSMNPKQILNVWTTQNEQNVISRLLEIPHYSLENNADWGLGIVTGDNKNKCKMIYKEGLVPIFRGKDITPTKLNTPALYIDPDLSKCQQVAPLRIYYANKKIIYRFISDRLIFFCDTKQTLILNSANALVLKENFPISSEQLVSLLNSRIMNWIFIKVFRTHKILRTDIEKLPLYSSDYIENEFDEESFLINNNITYTNGTFSIKRQDLPNI